MKLRINPSDPVPIYMQIVRQIRYMAASGVLRPGDKLPPVRKLAQDVVVNPNTVAKAYRELEARGVVTSRQGSGVFVSPEGSNLSRKEKMRILTEHVDHLLSEARQLEVSEKDVEDLVRKRNNLIREIGGNCVPNEKKA